MQAFDYCRRTRIIFGEGRAAEIGKIADEYGKKALFVTYDECMAEMLRLSEKLVKPMKEEEIEVLECYGVKSNPTVEHTRTVLEKARDFQPDVIVAAGGGSVIDECKFLSAALHYQGDPWDLASGKAQIGDTTPVIAVVTMPATSSEMNDTAVITNEALERKEGFSTIKFVPEAALLDPEFTYNIPLRQTGYSATDIVSHLLEVYISHKETFVPMQNRYCEGMIKTIMDCMDRILENPQDREARAMFMWTATNAWNGFYVCGLGPANSMIHILGHPLSGLYDTPHGAAMGVTIPATIRATLTARKERYARMARQIFGVDEDDDLRAARKGLEMMNRWIKKTGTPTSLEDAGIPTDRLDDLARDAQKTAASWGVGDLYPIEYCKELYLLCRKDAEDKYV